MATLLSGIQYNALRHVFGHQPWVTDSSFCHMKSDDFILGDIIDVGQTGFRDDG